MVRKLEISENAEKRPCCNPQCCKYIVTTTSLILLYFSLSIGLTFYQRWLLQRLRFPLFITTGHLFIKFLLALIIRNILECYFKKPRVTLDWHNYCVRAGPVGLASAFDVAFSNWGLEFITVSLYTMTKSTSIIFILIFSLLFKLEKKSWKVIAIVLMISGGLLMTTYKSTQFNLIGFLLVLLASFSSGLRWTLAQLLMQKSRFGLSNPLDMIYHVQPWMIILVFPFAISFEGVAVASSTKFFNYAHIKDIGYTVWTILLGAFIAFCMECSEYLVVSCTSSLTLSVACIFKEVCTLVLAVEWTGDQISEINALGLLLCLGGISLHILNKAITASGNIRDSSSRDQEISVVGGERSELHMPLLAEESSFSSQMILDDSDSDENSNVLFSVLQRRDNATYETEDG
ncbi:UNVERIFIED_CONTAM: hypothetical protein PYX00_001284 [Menopon gallinae]|uniref:Sugar phosphate transporter domain-containing protein n=1 Tax=Menopon gallinae TaxID=328185 RepID=A0AAW2IE97_9NEOP